MDKNCGNCSCWSDSTRPPFGLCSSSKKKGLINQGGDCPSWRPDKEHPAYISNGIDEIRGQTEELDTLRTELERCKLTIEDNVSDMEDLIKERDEVKAERDRDWSRGFEDGRNAVMRKNESGCCCKIDEDDNLVSPCLLHKTWMESALEANHE